MSNQSTPILLLIFNRPDKTRKIFKIIKTIQPLKLYIAADGPREGNISDIELCKKTRDIFSNIPWECSIKTLFREKNQGCKHAVSSAISWFFTYELEGIILEDDCIPHPDFFRFCTELLEKYRGDERVMMISGNNFLFSKYKPNDSYYFSLQTHIWGWATWKRAWDYYDADMKKWPEFKNQNLLSGHYQDNYYRKCWRDIIDRVYRGEIQTWDYQWQYTCWTQNGLSIMPSENLVLNIGNDSEGTHYNPSGKDQPEQFLHGISYPLNHPEFIIRNYVADSITLDYIFPRDGFFQRIMKTSKYMVNKIIRRIVRKN